MQPGECIKRKRKKKVEAKYSPAHIVLPQRAGERESKPHVTDVSYVTECTAGRSQARKAVREPYNIAALVVSASRQRCCSILWYIHNLQLFLLLLSVSREINFRDY